MQRINVEVTDLRGLSVRFGVPLWTLRKWASERKFPGIIKTGRRVYVDISKFRNWFYEGELERGENNERDSLKPRS